MTRTYQATGIILKGMPLGEADRLLTILSPEFGLIRAVAPGARKHKSKLRGRSELFVVNQLLIAKGRSLDKITQAETLESYPRLSRDLGKLTASQYIAELVLCLALSEQPQAELYELLNEHLRRIEQFANSSNLVAHLAQAVFHLLAIAGIAPEVHRCCLTQKSLIPQFSDPRWRVGFSFESGGLVNLSVRGAIARTATQTLTDASEAFLPKVNAKLGALELSILQHLGVKSLPEPSQILAAESLKLPLDVAWVKVEHLLRDYAQYHFGRSFRSASLVDALSPLEF
ncbi:MAG: DNA repair protein RecO [Hydrococcus sp. C42_A2020_068]|uniref:DNA repair protein RecO n=1 Tax=Pleurocapsa sp. PCC 7327 TaxID=118163 RepID=UPI00029FE1A9|nr:DNA repair protein RecO [Pleurocapsa sp. PCC 7327]AFY76178.1 DNA replication and repair protein RecO [Pleurocapsa sp. PCC 7327]MBF2019009.1 DNA repair protein RecO [Hydrococcus sp. C42_A2020_068]